MEVFFFNLSLNLAIPELRHWRTGREPDPPRLRTGLGSTRHESLLGFQSSYCFDFSSLFHFMHNSWLCTYSNVLAGSTVNECRRQLLFLLHPGRSQTIVNTKKSSKSS